MRYPVRGRSALSVLAFLSASALMAPAHAADQVTAGDLAHQVVPVIASNIADVYPFPDLGAQYARRVTKALAQGRYNGLSGVELATALDADLQSVHPDKHLAVRYSHRGHMQASGDANDIPNQRKERHDSNFGFTSVQVDPSTSTTYVKSGGPWWPEQETFAIAAGAMAVASQSDNVIIDLRNNGGGSGVIGRFLASYFLDTGDERFYLDGFGRTSAQKVQEWTYAYVPGQRMPHARLIILVNRNTASASEGFAYAMQQMHRATIVGETTAGAGIATGAVPLAGDLVFYLPSKMVVGPNTTKGWEGTGVIPDVPVGDRDARKVAEELIRPARAAG